MTDSQPSTLAAAAAPGERRSLWAELRDAVRGTGADYTKIPLRRAVFLLAVPMVLELVLESTFAVVDIFFVGKLGSSAVATVGLRVPGHATPRALAAALGPLPTTSANRSGEPEARDADEIEAILGDAIELILYGGPSSGGLASTVVDLGAGNLRILRHGAVPEAAIRRTLESATLREVGR